MIQPNATLYCKNIDWKIKKGLLKRALYSLFSRHGKVLEIIVLRKDGLRGQAFVIMEDVQAATAAMQAEQGFTFFGKDMVIEYARAKSDRIAKRDGDYVHKAKRQKVEAAATESQAADAAKEALKEDAMEEETEATKEAAAAPPPPVVEEAPPSKMLLAQNLPAECSVEMLKMLFQSYNGLKDVRLPRPGLAFIEFDDEPHATIAKKALDGFNLTKQDTLHLTYGKA